MSKEEKYIIKINDNEITVNKELYNILVPLGKIINNLQEENKQLKEENNELSKMCELYSKSLYNAELKQLKERIDKALEYIKENSRMSELEIYGISNSLTFIGNLENLLEILKGE